MSYLVSRALKWPSSVSLLVKACSHPKQSQFSNKAGSFVVTFDTLLSTENKLEAQKKLTTEIPVRTSKEYPLKKGYTYAAVLVPLCTVDGEPSLLFTLRSSQLQKHRGQVSFPGGNMDKSDKDATHTALRETHEELGLDPSCFDVWGQLNKLPGSAGNKVIYPILARTGEVDVASLKFNRDEVEEVFHVTLRHLCDPKNIGSTRFSEGPGYTLPVYLGAQHRIWGLTAIIVHQMLNIVTPGLYNFKLKHKRSVLEGSLGSKLTSISQSSKDSW